MQHYQSILNSIDVRTRAVQSLSSIVSNSYRLHKYLSIASSSLLRKARLLDNLILIQLKAKFCWSPIDAKKPYAISSMHRALEKSRHYMSEAINQKPDQHSGQFPVQKSGQRPDEQSDQHSGQLSTQKSDQKHNEKPDEKPAPKPSLKPTPKPTLKPGQNQEPSGHKKRPQKRKPNYEQASFPDWKIEGDLLVAVTPGSLPPGKDWLIWFLVGLLLFLTCVDRWR